MPADAAAFWDSSALVPLCLRQQETPAAVRYARQFPRMVVWWSAAVESHSAIARAEREGVVSANRRKAALIHLARLQSAWFEILPTEAVRAWAVELLWKHSLRAADSLQLAASLEWCRGKPRGRAFVCFDERLCKAAEQVGLSVFSC